MPFKIFTTPWSEKKNEEEKKEEGKVDEKKAEEVKVEAPKIGAMPNGDYMVHVLIQQGKNFILNDEQIVNPIIEVSCFKEKQYSTSKSEVMCKSESPSRWNEHLFFELKKMHSQDMANGCITILIKNKHWYKDQIIGAFTFSVTNIYFQENHTIEHQWIAMFNPESDNLTQITANLKVSIHIMGKNDPQKQLEVQSGPDNYNTQLLMPSQVQHDYKQLIIRFLTANNLVDLDWNIAPGFSNNTMDVYFQTSVMGKEIFTKPITAKDGSADVDQEMWIPITLPLTNDRLVIQCLDQDNTSSDLAGSLVYKITDLIQMGEKEGGTWKWQNIYGAPPNNLPNEHYHQMNQNPEMASAWNGRVLIHISVQPTTDPKLKVEKMKETYRKDAIEKYRLFTLKKFDMMFQIGQGISLPLDNYEFGIQIQIGEKSVSVLKPLFPPGQGYNRWLHRSEQIEFESYYQSLEEMEYFYVYLMQDTKPVCFWRGKVQDFTDPNPEMKWITMKNDLSVGEVKENHKAGMIQIRLSVNSRAQSGPIVFSNYPNWQINIKSAKKLTPYRVRVFIYQCRDIPSADASSLTDCYITVWQNDKKQIEKAKTQVCRDTLNPIFYETLDFFYDMDDKLRLCPPLIINLWDQDGMLDADDFLGMAQLHINKGMSNVLNVIEDGLTKAQQDIKYNEIPKPKWIDIHSGFDENSPVTGQILCSAVVARSDHNYIPEFLDLDQYVKKKEYDIYISVLGLRNLKSSGILPVRQAFIRFNIRSMLPPSRATSAKNIETEHNSSGPNPNINTAIHFVQLLPEDSIYCQDLTCEVFDYIFLGAAQPLIGSFTIPISEVRTQNQQDVLEELEILDQIQTLLESYLYKAQNNLDSYRELIQNKLDNQQNKALSPEADALKQHLKSQIAAPNRENQSNAVQSKGQNDGYQKFEDELIDPEDIQVMRPLSIQEQIEDLQKQIEVEIGEQQNKQQSARKQNKGQSLVSERRNNKLKKMEIKLKELQEIKRKVERELDQSEDVDKKIPPICIPKYAFDDKLKLIFEDDIPKESIYRAVGFNNTETINKMYDIYKEREVLNLFGDHNYFTRHLAGYETLQRQQDAQNEESQMQTQIQAEKEILEKMTQTTNKHYRIFYDKNLEDIEHLFPKNRNIFQKYPIKRGQTRGTSSSIFDVFSENKTDESGFKDTTQIVGQFKGIINVVNAEEVASFRAKKLEKIQRNFTYLDQLMKLVWNKNFQEIKLQEMVQSKEEQEKFWRNLRSLGIVDAELQLFKDLLIFQKFTGTMSKQLLRTVPATVTLYMLQGHQFASRDFGSDSDPYLIINCGDNKFSERENYQTDMKDPKFNKVYTFSVNFPGAPMIVIEAYDYDILFGDDLIGYTEIDLDDRFYSIHWQALEQKPIESRALHHPNCNLSQGIVDCWVEIQDMSKAKDRKQRTKQWELKPEPVQKFQLRVAVMDCKNVSPQDVEDTTDLYIQVFIDEKNKKTTDTHFRLMKGNDGSFNYRCLLEFETPRDDYLLTLQAFDRDLFKANDFICQWQLDLKELIEITNYKQRLMQLNKNFVQNFLLKKKGLNMPGLQFKADNDDTFYIIVKDNQGKGIEIGLDIRCCPMTNMQPVVGEGRNAPNLEPFLPEPVGRISFSWNPWTMLTQLVSKELLLKYIWLVIALGCCVILISLVPLFATDIISIMIMK